MWSSLTEGANCIRWRSLLRSRGREERQSRPRSSSRTRQRGCGRVVRLFENLVSKRVLFPCPSARHGEAGLGKTRRKQAAPPAKYTRSRYGLESRPQMNREGPATVSDVSALQT